MEGLQLKIFVKVKPNAKKTQILSQQDNEYVICVKSPPIDGKANEELTKFLRKHFKVKVKLKSGITSKIKTFEIEN